MNGNTCPSAYCAPEAGDARFIEAGAGAGTTGPTLIGKLSTIVWLLIVAKTRRKYAPAGEASGTGRYALPDPPEVGILVTFVPVVKLTR
jgi:hypothetical protein